MTSSRGPSQPNNVVITHCPVVISHSAEGSRLSCPIRWLVTYLITNLSVAASVWVKSTTNAISLILNNNTPALRV